jgi:competence protein ComEA
LVDCKEKLALIIMNKPWWWLGAFILVGLLLGIGFIFLITRPPRGEPITLLPPPTSAPITVYVSGSVARAGLYTLPPGSRLNDAIQAAGGFTEQANSSGLNLASILKDGQQIDVPLLIIPSHPEGNGSSLTSPQGLVNINNATLEQLDSLPGIGPITAQDIIDYRDVHGPFISIEHLIDIPGIGQATFDKIKGLVTVGTSP